MSGFFDLSLKRNIGEAIIFYFVCLILSLGITILVEFLLTFLSTEFGTGAFFASIIPVVLSVGILRAKNRWQLLYIFLAGSSFFLGSWLGALVGLVIPTYFSTLSRR